MYSTCSRRSPAVQGDLDWSCRTRLALHNIQCVALFNVTDLDFPTAGELIMTACALKHEVDKLFALQNTYVHLYTHNIITVTFLAWIVCV